MKILKIISFLIFGFIPLCTSADSLFFDDEPVQDGLNVKNVSNTFADIYEKLDSVRFGGKNINIAIESLENLNKNAHVAATDERVVLVWGDTIVGNYPRPSAKDWYGFGEITTALILKMRAYDARLHNASESEMYKLTVDALMQGVDENGRYIFSRDAEIKEDGRIITSAGFIGMRDERGNFRITGVYKSSPADLAGIASGDLVSKINGRAISQMSDADIDSVINGFNSGTIKMRLITPSGNRDVVLRRATVVLADADVVSRDAGDNGVILEIVVNKITDNAVAIVNEALYSHDNISGVILDLRAATGDDIRAAAKMAGLFVGRIPVMRVIETAAAEVEVVPGADAVTDAPVVLLLSNMTRGTAEALVATFYENGRGVLVGTPTAGKARIATIIDLDNGGALELLNKTIKTGTGRRLDGFGVFPTVCLSNIRSTSQEEAFFLNVINGGFEVQDFNRNSDVDVDALRKGCPVITSGEDEDAMSLAVAAKILTDKKVYNRLIAE
ncbi:MAG: PDZ domain-containing protein [Proteobacteria bacterium]|nr:PDZ domain-containing protein [Candidatus Enterousia scatequi]